MSTTNLKRWLIIPLFLLSMNIFSQNVIITVSNLKTSDGQVSLGVYKDQDTYDKETPYLAKTFPKAGKVVNGTMKIALTLPPGVYGIVMMDDQNNDSKMEYNWLGLPREGFGFSNYYSNGFSKPDLSDFKVSLAGNQSVPITIKVRYL